MPTIRFREFWRGCAEGATSPARTASATATSAAKTTRLRMDALHRRQHPAQAFLEVDLRLPAEQLLGARDVRLADQWVVDRQGLEDDLARRLRDPKYRLGELEDRELARVAEVDREVLLSDREQVEAADQVVDVAEAPRLRAVTEDRKRLVLERLADEARDRAAVVRAHPRSVRVDDPDDGGVHALLVVVRHRQRLGVALRLVVDPARSEEHTSELQSLRHLVCR